MGYYIPKDKTKVEICFDKHGMLHKQHATIFLDVTCPHHSGNQTIQELLNSGNQFIPLIIQEEDGELSLFNIEMLNFVTSLEEEVQHHDVEFEIQFITGDAMTVNSCEILPEFHSRPIDYLNSPETFLTFQHSGKKIYINKHRIKRITSL